MFTPSQFADAITALRPALLRHACAHRPCQTEDAEDLVSDAVCEALRKLASYDRATGTEGLLSWMRGMVGIVILRDRRRAAQSVTTVPLETAASLPAPPPMVASQESIAEKIQDLPDTQRLLVQDWLDGYSQREIGWRHRRRDCEGNLRPLHRNTVANRLELAFQALKVAIPDADDLTYSSSLIDFCSRVTLYDRPQGVWRSWRHSHPRDIRFRLDGRTRSGFSIRKAAMIAKGS